MSSPIDPLQAKIQTQIIQATFMKNMAFLKIRMPEVFQYFQNYQPKMALLAFDKSGYVNLISNNKYVYQGDPKTSSEKQVDEFLKKPPCFDFEVLARKNTNYLYQHEKVLHEIYNKRRAELGAASPFQLDEGGQINFIAFMGSGLGYHLNKVFMEYSIRSAFIFEPEPDVFFATLHCSDISVWFDQCRQLGGELTLKVGGIEEEFVNDIYQYFKREGSFNLPQMYLYRHYMSDKTTDAFKLINELEYRYKSGWGFCEDEIIGISHTLSNISNSRAATLLESAKKEAKNTPVFIIGNGPSLDSALEYIKDNQQGAIIISSGTSLKPLLNYGIKPDLHVEQERPKSIYQWVKKVGFEDTLKDIPLLCLNTVYPGILELFKQPYVMLKAGDAGTSFIHDYISEQYLEMFYCNPTVTNASTSAAIAMGFKNITLFGLDYGFKSEDDHHAKGSIYQDIKGYKVKGDFKVPGNFGGEVHTTRIFDYSRGVLELLLEQNPDVECVNTSDGADVKLAPACKVEALCSIKPIPEKKNMVDDCLADCFDNSYSLSHNLCDEFKSVLSKFEGYVSWLIDCLNQVKTKNELTSVFSQQFKFVNHYADDKDKLLFHRFFGGSLNYLQASIMNNVARYPTGSKQQEYIRYCVSEMQGHLTFLLKDLADNYNKGARA